LKTRDQARLELFDFIAGFYNPRAAGHDEDEQQR